MDKIRIDFFDVLGYLVPGSVLLMVLWIGTEKRVASIDHIPGLLRDMDQKALLLAVFPAYIAGFLLHALGSALYDAYRYKKRTKHVSGQVQDNWAYVREYGGKHIAILERWYALRAFSQNLAAVSLIAGILCVAKWWTTANWEWLGVAIGTLVFCWMSLRRSDIFNRFLNDDIAAVLRLGLGPKKDIS
jgi:hypothetical protein